MGSSLSDVQGNVDNQLSQNDSIITSVINTLSDIWNQMMMYIKSLLGITDSKGNTDDPSDDTDPPNVNQDSDNDLGNIPTPSDAGSSKGHNLIERGASSDGYKKYKSNLGNDRKSPFGISNKHGKNDGKQINYRPKS